MKVGAIFETKGVASLARGLDRRVNRERPSDISPASVLEPRERVAHSETTRAHPIRENDCEDPAMAAGTSTSRRVDYEIVIIGCGTAGLSAAVRAKETNASLSVAVLERTTKLDRGGNSRWTAATLRLDDPYTVTDSFVDDMIRYSEGRSDVDYIHTLAEHLPEAMDWLQGFGIRLRRAKTIFVTSAAQRLLPIGGGERLVEVLADEAERLGVEFLYETSAIKLLTSESGETGGLVVRKADGRLADITARAVIIASGGFEGNDQMLTQYLGSGVPNLFPLSPGGAHNKGEGIRMALDVGAMSTGEWGAFHGEPIDPRSGQAEAVVMVFPYGILVNSEGLRFADEGSGLADEICEDVSRKIWAQDGGVAYFIGDQRLYSVPGHEHALMTDQPPILADSVEELAALLGVEGSTLERTILEFNAAVCAGEYEPTKLDGKHTEGITPPKSNWAQPLEQLPLVAYPVGCAIVFTFGGIGTSTSAEVLSADGTKIPGLFAAGECTGIYHGTYPGSTSVMRALVFGRISGESAANYEGTS